MATTLPDLSTGSFQKTRPRPRVRVLFVDSVSQSCAGNLILRRPVIQSELCVLTHYLVLHYTSSGQASNF